MKSAVLSCLLTVGLLLSPSTVFAHPAPTNPVPNVTNTNTYGKSQPGQAGSFNLRSTQQLFTAGSLNGLSQVILDMDIKA